MKLITVFMLLDAAKHAKSDVAKDAIMDAITSETGDNITSDFGSAMAQYIYGSGTLADVKVQYERLQIT